MFTLPVTNQRAVSKLSPMPKKPSIPPKKKIPRNTSQISSSQPMTIMPLSRMQDLQFRCLLHRSTPHMELRTVFTFQMPTEERPFNMH
ncbi:hypothetical protein TNCV_2495301 [Trichonephila clavipes]|nr:hypothetical protein TNCV_2495301 [Trichonephila clavipes]